MSPLPLPPSSPALPAGQVPPWWRRHNRFALALVLLVHAAILILVLLSPARMSVPPTPDSRITEVRLFLPKPAPPKTTGAMPAGVKAVRPTVEPPPPKAPKRKAPPLSMPPLDFVPDAIQTQVSEPPAALAPADALAGQHGTGTGNGNGTGTGGNGRGSGSTARLFEDCANSPDRHMVADVYRLSNDTRSVTDMRWRKPIKRVCLANLDIAPRSFLEGFPGMGTTVEWFGLDIRFTVNVEEGGEWDLMLLSDDGAILSIDELEVINNDGIHGPIPVMVPVKLEKGLRNFRVRFFQGPRYGIALMLGWKKPGAADFDFLPRKLIGRPPAGLMAALPPRS